MNTERESFLNKKLNQNIDDIFYLNKEKPLTFFSKTKTKLKKWVKSFGLGFGAFFIYEVWLKIVKEIYELFLVFCHFNITVFYMICGWLEVINSSLKKSYLSSLSYKPEYFSGVADLLSSGSYLLGLAFGIKAILILKEHTEIHTYQARQNLKQFIFYTILSSIFLSLPTLLNPSYDKIYSINYQQTQSNL